MTRDVLIRISGSQISDNGQEEIELVTTGDYFLKDGKHYVLYDEISDDTKAIIKNTVKITSDSMEVIKGGSTSTHMVFHKNQKNVSCYQTPFGELMVGISTNEICIEETENLLKAVVVYSLDINYEHISNCNITIEIKPKK